MAGAAADTDIVAAMDMADVADMWVAVDTLAATVADMPAEHAAM
jgi:hypothetical protein